MTHPPADIAGRICPRAKSDMTPCFVKDGVMAVATNRFGTEICVGCEEFITRLSSPPAPVTTSSHLGGNVTWGAAAPVGVSMETTKVLDLIEALKYGADEVDAKSLETIRLALSAATARADAAGRAAKMRQDYIDEMRPRLEAAESALRPFQQFAKAYDELYAANRDEQVWFSCNGRYLANADLRRVAALTPPEENPK